MMSLPRQHANPYAAVSPSSAYSQSSYPYSGRDGTRSGAAGFRVPRIIKRLFKFPQMDFEVAVWEMTNLMLVPSGPKKVVKNLWYHKQTKNTYSSTDPAFPYLLSFFLLISSLAWSLAYTHVSFPNILRVAVVYVLLHCLLSSLLMATVMYFTIGRLLGPGGVLVRGSRGRGLFGMQGAREAGEELEFAFCFDVAIRSFFPLWVSLYVIQFMLLPAVTSHRWISNFLSNTLYSLAFAHSTYITFLGYNSLPFLSSTHLLLLPLLVYLLLWIVGSATGFNTSLHFAPILWCGGGIMRKTVG